MVCYELDYILDVDNTIWTKAFHGEWLNFVIDMRLFFKPIVNFEKYYIVQAIFF